MLTSPAVGIVKPDIIWKVVVLPAPFTPNSPNIIPLSDAQSPRAQHVLSL